MTTHSSYQLPRGFEVRLRADLIQADGGSVLVGGSPARASRLSEQARRMVSSGRLTVTDPASAELARRLLEGNLADPMLEGFPQPDGDLTVVVPVRDRPEQLARCLEALGGLPVIIVDDASREPAAVRAVATRSSASLIRLESNVGPAGARNVGLERVTTPLVAFVDSDVVIEAAALARLARHCADPGVVLVGPRVRGAIRTPRRRWFQRYDEVASSLDLGSASGQVRPGAALGWLPSACLVGRVSLIRALDGFAPDLRVAEDVDLVWRAVDAGLAVRYEPAECALHDVRQTIGGWASRKFLYGTGGGELGLRHGNKIAPAALSISFGLAAAALLQRRWWSIPAAGIATLPSIASLRAHLPVQQGATGIAVRMSVRGLGWGVRQESTLLLRHWWPVGLLAGAMSRHVRRALMSAALVDLCVFYREQGGVDAPTALVARRVDDIAYGAGLWWGAWRHRDLYCLMPRAVRRTSPPGSA